MSNISIVDYLKMAAGFNRNDSGGIDRRSISPWAQSPNSTNQYSSPNHSFNDHFVPRPPPPPMFRRETNSFSPRNFQYRDDVSRNAFETSSNSQFDCHNYRNNMNNINGHLSENFNSSRHRYQHEGHSNRFEKDRNKWRYQNRRNKHKGNLSDQREGSSSYRDRNENDSDIECISIVGNSSENLPNRSIASSEISEVENQQESSVSKSNSVHEISKDGMSRLERAYHRRMSQNSDNSDISVVSSTTLNINHSTPVENSIPRRPPCYTPRSPER